MGGGAGDQIDLRRIEAERPVGERVAVQGDKRHEARRVPRQFRNRFGKVVGRVAEPDQQIGRQFLFFENGKTDVAEVRQSVKQPFGQIPLPVKSALDPLRVLLDRVRHQGVQDRPHALRRLFQRAFQSGVCVRSREERVEKGQREIQRVEFPRPVD